MSSKRKFGDELYVSVSNIRLLESCHRAWFYRYMLGAPAEDVSARLILGSACHEALAMFYSAIKDGHPEPSLGVMVGIATDYMTRAAAEPVPILFDDGQGLDELIAEAARMLEAFAENPYRPKAILAVEEAFTTAIVHPITGEVVPFEERIGGVWDLVVVDGDEVVVVDHKFRKRAEPDGPADLQLAIYGQAAEAIYQRPVRVMHQNIIGTKQARAELQEHTLGPQAIAEGVEAVTAGLELIHLGIAHENPMRLMGRRRSWRCGSCSFRRRCAGDRS